MSTTMPKRMAEQEHHAVPVTADPCRSMCARCGGLLVRDLWGDLITETNPFIARRCVQCGEILDFVILRNRWLQQRSTVVPSLRASAHLLNGQAPSPRMP